MANEPNIIALPELLLFSNKDRSILISKYVLRTTNSAKHQSETFILKRNFQWCGYLIMGLTYAPSSSKE